MSTGNEQRFRDEKRALMADLDLPENSGTPHNCRCWYADKQMRIRRVRIRLAFCAVATMAAWLFVGWKGGYLFDGEGCTKGLVPTGWLWAGGGEVALPGGEEEEDAMKKHDDFSKIKPSRDLHWKPCYDQFQCARLSVPLDYENPDGPEAAIALVKLPAKRPKKGNHGSVLLNPGGPGGSGTTFLMRAGESIQFIVGEDKDLIGFDPRGILHTRPLVDCFNSCSLSREKMLMRLGEELGEMNEASMATPWARVHSVGHLCNRLDDIGPHVGTTNVARDMLSIVEAEQREAGLEEKDGKLWYWGFSYGSILGQTFATMFPDRVGRLIVDGVCDLPDYYRTDWRLNLMDGDLVFDQFLQLCYKAGKGRCRFFTGDGPSDIRKRTLKLIDALNEKPLIVYSKEGYDTEVITGNDLRGTIALLMYSPLGGFELLSEIMVGLEKRRAEQFNEAPFGNVDTCSCKIGYVPAPAAEAQMAIMCGDGNVVTDTMAEFMDYKNYLVNQSSTMGNFMARARLMCTNYKLQAKSKFQGLPEKGQVQTSHPLLFLTTLFDPVTPAINAHTMSKRFKGASVVLQNSSGHCSISSPSICTFSHIRNYFDKGTLPEWNSTCEADILPFLGPREGVFHTAEQEIRINVARKIAANIPILGAGHENKILRSTP